MAANPSSTCLRSWLARGVPEHGAGLDRAGECRSEIICTISFVVDGQDMGAVRGC